MLEEASYCERNIVRQPRLHHAIAEQRASGFATRGRHVRQQDWARGRLALQPLDQRCDRTRFAERHRMDPQRSGRVRSAAVEAEALAHVGPVAGSRRPRHQRRSGRTGRSSHHSSV
jgi:uncharacterized protein (DUF1800 family)